MTRKKKKKEIKEEKITTPKVSKPAWSSTNPILAITVKFGVVTIILFGLLSLIEAKGYFNPDNKNNHTLRKWNTYYEFTETHPVDILLLGNSHLYTGINPKNLSAALGCNSFIIASPGTFVIDHYYSLVEALKISSPKLVIVETFGLRGIEPHDFSKGDLSDQFKSFMARKDIPSKLVSTPHIFAIENYPYAWFNSLRNHSYLYTNQEQIKKNLENKNQSDDKDDKLYLGRYVRFQTGIEDSTIQKYKTQGAPVDGNEFETNDVLAEYTQKIINLCEENNIELAFVTLPMFKKHVSSYDTWKFRLDSVIPEPYSTSEYWLDMQDEKGYNGFTRRSFENTYRENQHMTYSGSLLATYKLVDFIQEQDRIQLPNRKNDSGWRNMFYEQEGFFENNTPSGNDNENIVLFQSTNPNDLVTEILHIKSDKNHRLIIKSKPKNSSEYNTITSYTLRLHAVVKDDHGKVINTVIDVPYDKFHSSHEAVNHTTGIIPIEFLQVSKVEYINS